MGKYKRTHKCAKLSSENIGEEVILTGWVSKSRNKGSIVFTDLRDISGLIQIIFEEPSVSKEEFEEAGKLHSEYVIMVKGIVRKRDGAFNKNLKTGEIEVIANKLNVISRSETLPFPIEEDSKTKEELRLKYRYLDLRRRDLSNNLILRSKVCMLVRNFLEKEGFLEIETPILNRSTPEGARDYLVPSRVNEGHFYALPQSPQLFKQLLMCSGYDRYFQIAKCFRDEDLRADRQPEFTQIDMELSFVDVDDVIDINERLLKYVFKEAINVDISLPIKKMTWDYAMDNYGSDKPDLRFDIKITDISDIAKTSSFKVFNEAVKNGGFVRGINAKGLGDISRKKLDKFTDSVKDYGAKGLAYIAINSNGEIKSSFSKFISNDELEKIKNKMDAINSDLLLFIADSYKVVCDSLGYLRVEVAKELNIIDDDKFEFVWVTDFPQFEFSKDQNRYVAMHHPFTMPFEEDLCYLDTDLSKVRAKAYDIVLNGCELGGGSIRIHNSDIQSKMLKCLGFTEEKANESFGFLLEAFRYGVPPHGGLAYGLDRMLMLMSKSTSIRDVIAFPKNKDAQCLMSAAPGVVDDKQLLELGIKQITEEKK